MSKYKSTVVLLAALALPSDAAQGQIIRIDSLSNWKKSFRIGLNLNQANFSGNWKAGGVNSFGFNALVNLKANYKKDKITWDNEIDLLYGMISNAGQGYRKTLDRIFIDTKYGRAISAKWNWSLSMNLQSQFASGYKYTKDAAGLEQEQLISGAFAPVFVTVALGAEYVPTDYFKVRISPIAPRFTHLGNNDGRYSAVDPQAPYGVKVGESTRYEWYAFQILADFNKDIAANVNLKVRYVIFANYNTLEMNKVDHRVDLSLVAKVNDYINVSIGGIFLYDFDQDISPQYSQALSLGILYSFQNFEDKK